MSSSGAGIWRLSRSGSATVPIACCSRSPALMRRPFGAGAKNWPPHWLTSRRTASASLVAAGHPWKKTVPAEPASARAPTMGSVGPFELAPAPDPERLMPLLPSLFFSGPGSFGGGWLERWVGRFAEVGEELAQASADGCVSFYLAGPTAL